MLVERHSHIKYILPIIFLSVIVIVLLATAMGTASLLTETKSILTSTRSELSNALNEAETTRTKLTTTATELTQTRIDFAATQSKLTNVQSELQITSVKLAATVDKWTETGNDLATTRNDLATERQKADSLQTNLDNLQANYDRLTTGYGYVLKDPTYQALKSFIAADKTDSKPYDINSYNCSDFSADVITNAAKQKIRCAYISIDYAGKTGHAIVAFDTTDKGLIYIEPQHDEEVNLQLGKHYYQCVIPKPGYYYAQPSYDDTIVKITIIW